MVRRGRLLQLAERAEGIPKDQWCYLPNKEGRYAQGMTIAVDFLNRSGYRLPTSDGVGVRLPRWHRDTLVAGRSRRLADQVRLVCQQFVEPAAPGRDAAAQRYGSLRYARQRLGVVLQDGATEAAGERGHRTPSHEPSAVVPSGMAR